MRRYRPWSERRRKRFEAKQIEKQRKAEFAEESEAVRRELLRRDFERLAQETHIDLVPIDDSPMGNFVYDLVEKQEPLDTALHVKKAPEPVRPRASVSDLVLPFISGRTTHGVSEENLPWWHR